MYSIRYFNGYVTDGTNVYTRDRMFPAEPRIHPTKGYKQYFLRQDDGVVQMVSQKLIDNLTIRLARSNTRGKSVKHIPTGKVYDTIKDAVSAHNMSAAKLKASKEFVIN
ncbi:hypothetical protein BST79_gp091 [Only Syngen Nebraska virus 5]|uniref:hypothetical protein n=1 Tax=Only Syngen Nebraska virus 5 TaxID=1917232 RepID=UPI000900AA1F|nr:hypothetical protein BST79_gp091 [Only Syngen Nebraska virus 5]APC25604.1 hypothetical protein [Only Syngen Nebraska virus 5]